MKFLHSLLVPAALMLGRSSAEDTAAALRGTSDRQLQSFAVTGFELINASNGQVVATISPGKQINVGSIGALNLKATVSGSVGSVRFGYGSNTSFQTESFAPYAFCGDSGGVYKACSQLKVGSHTVSATPFSGSGASGSSGKSFSMTFSIITGGPAPAPAPVPVPVPVPAPIPAPVPVPVPAPIPAPVPVPVPVPAPIPAPVPVPVPVPSPTPPHSTVKWQGPIDTPLIAVAAANLPNGKIVFWSSYIRTGYQGDGGTETWTAIYDPNSGSITDTLVRTNHDMFCPGTSMLGDGVLMVTGGSNSKATTFYDYRNNRWSRGPALVKPRGYHAHTVLGNGDVITIGGSWSGGGGHKDGEIWSPQSNSWRRLTGIPSEPLQTGDSKGSYRSDNHYWLFLAPNGKLFHAGPSKDMHWITTSGSGSIQGAGSRADDQDAMNGNAIMYDTGKILCIGGAANYDQGTSSNRAYVVDINGSSANVKRVSNMNYRRALLNGVVLPSGEVVVIGGMSSVKLFSDNNAIYEAEIFDPKTETFKTLAKMKIARTYHSVALLLKDGRVWAAGGGLCFGCSANHNDFEILTPPYLLNADGSAATRPVIQSSSSSAKAGNVISVRMNTSQAHTFALVRTSAVTHSVNNDQRRIPLTVTSTNGSTFSLKIPNNPNVALTGAYYLFAMNENGVPSVAASLQISL